MQFKDLVSKGQELAGAASDVAGKFTEELNEALPTMRALGFTIKDLQVGMALVPEIGFKLIAAADTVDAAKIKDMIDKHPENKTLIGMLKGLQLAYNVKQQITDFPFKGVQVDVTLGLPPHVGVSFLNNAPAAIAVGTAGAINP